MNNSSSRSIRNARSSQRGFTLIELAIALTIAMFLIAGVTTIVMNVRTTYGIQSQLAQLQDNERLAMSVMTDVIQQTGYYGNPVANSPGTAMPSTPEIPTAGQAIIGTSNSAAPGDSVTVRYAMTTADGIFNCAGASGNGSYESQFSVVSATQTLQCVPYVNGVAGAAVPLATGVTNMSILYGISTTPTSQTCADSYLTATEVQATPAYWLSVCSVRVTLTFTNPNRLGKPIQFTRVISIMKTAGANT